MFIPVVMQGAPGRRTVRSHSWHSLLGRGNAWANSSPTWKPSWLSVSSISRACVCGGVRVVTFPRLLCAASIFSNYELALVPGQKVETEMAITLRFRYGLTCTLRPATKASC